MQMIHEKLIEHIDKTINEVETNEGFIVKEFHITRDVFDDNTTHAYSLVVYVPKSKYSLIDVIKRLRHDSDVKITTDGEFYRYIHHVIYPI